MGAKTNATSRQTQPESSIDMSSRPIVHYTEPDATPTATRPGTSDAVTHGPAGDLGDASRQNRRIRFGTSFTLTVSHPTQAFFRVRPAQSLSVHERFLVVNDQTDVQVSLQPDVDLVAAGARSPQLMDRLVLPPGTTQIAYSGELTVDGSADPMPATAEAPRLGDLTPEDWLWLQPSRYCRPDELGEEAWSQFGRFISADRPPTGKTVRSICGYVNDCMQFEYGTTSNLTTATDSWKAKRGVCRDYNHIAVSFCRALNIPTRYAFGYLPDIDVEPSAAAMDFCAWFQVFLDGCWWTFDARVNEPRIGRIIVAVGRDAADVPLVSTLGPAVLGNFTVEASESILAESGAPLQPRR